MLNTIFFSKRFSSIFIFLFAVFIFFNGGSTAEALFVGDCNSPCSDIISKILKKEGIEDNSENRKSINDYLQIVSNFESRDLNLNSSDNKSSNAAGYFQFTPATLKDTKRQIAKLDPNFPDKGDITNYNRSEQAQLAMTLWWWRGNIAHYKLKVETNNVIASIVNKDKKVAKLLYCNIHHTDCPAQVGLERENQLNSEIENWGSNGEIPSMRSRDGVARFTTGGVSLGTSIRKAAQEAREEICARDADYGLVGYDGGICPDSPSGFDALISLIQRALNWIIRIAYLLAVISIFWGGFLLLTSNGNSERMSKAKSILTSVVIGLIVITAAWLIVGLIFDLFLKDDLQDDYKFIEQNNIRQ